MPLRSNPVRRGLLFIEMVVKFPTTLPLELVAKLAKTLPNDRPDPVDGSEEAVDLMKAKYSDVGGRKTHNEFSLSDFGKPLGDEKRFLEERHEQMDGDSADGNGPTECRVG